MKELPKPDPNLILVLGDIHNAPRDYVRHVIRKGILLGVGLVVCTGDITKEYMDAELFGNLPVICALVDEQNDDPLYVDNTPVGWKYTRSGPRRLVKFPDGSVAYVGHRKATDLLRMSQEAFEKELNDLRMLQDNLRWVIVGHTHFQMCMQYELIKLVNPGSIAQTLGSGIEFAILNTSSGEVVYDRIPFGTDDRADVSIAVLTGTGNLTHTYKKGWTEYEKEFQERNVTHIIISNFKLSDIGVEAFKSFKAVHYAIRSDQVIEHNRMLKEQGRIPENWIYIPGSESPDGAVVEIEGYEFYVDLKFGYNLMKMSGVDIDNRSMAIKEKYPLSVAAVTGGLPGLFYLEGSFGTYLNSGCGEKGNHGIIHMPALTFAFKCLPTQPLPPLPPLD
jgi:predicted phosphodiesterase